MDEVERSPSPALQPPVSLTPGPRATALQKLYAEAVAHVLKTCSYANFASCFPTPSQQVPQSLRYLHEQFTGHLGKSMRDEFENILVERDVVRNLNELDRLIDEARRRKQAADPADARPMPPHTLPAEQLFLSHLSPSLRQHSDAIREKQEQIQNDNVDTLQRVMEQRRRISALMLRFETAVADVEASVAALPPEDVESMRAEARHVDQVIRNAA